MVRKATRREGVLAGMLSKLSQENAADKAKWLERRLASELVSNLITRAEKGKDDIVQMFCRELGLAIAGILKEPLNQITETKQLQITIELVPKKKKKRTTRRQNQA